MAPPTGICEPTMQMVYTKNIMLNMALKLTNWVLVPRFFFSSSFCLKICRTNLNNKHRCAVFWPNINNDIEMMVSQCKDYLNYINKFPAEKMHDEDCDRCVYYLQEILFTDC